MEYKNRSVVIIGFGGMGSSWAESFSTQGGEISAIVDPDPSAEESVSQYNASLYSSLESMPSKLSEEVWCIATPSESHIEYLKEAIKRGVNDVLVEKPVTTAPMEAKDLDFSSVRGSVDFIELEHPVVKTILKHISESDFELGGAVHWRGKTSRKIRPYILDDMVHDISEIFALYNFLEYEKSGISVADVKNVTDWSETERVDDSFSGGAHDVSGTVLLEGFNNESICFKGGFNQRNERRYFLWVDENYETAYFGSTIRRDHLTPTACKITGWKNVCNSIETCLKGDIRNDIEISDFIESVDGKVIQSGSTTNDGLSRMELIASNILSGEKSPADIKLGLLADELIYEIYQQQNTVDPY